MFASIIRDQIEQAADLNSAQIACRHGLRLAVRKHLWMYASRHFIMDFDNIALVEARHRTFRDNVITMAQTKLVDIDTASTIGDVLAVFDTISQYL